MHYQKIQLTKILYVLAVKRRVWPAVQVHSQETVGLCHVNILPGWKPGRKLPLPTDIQHHLPFFLLLLFPPHWVTLCTLLSLTLLTYPYPSSEYSRKWLSNVAFKICCKEWVSRKGAGMARERVQITAHMIWKGQAVKQVRKLCQFWFYMGTWRLSVRICLVKICFLISVELDSGETLHTRLQGESGTILPLLAEYVTLQGLFLTLQGLLFYF